VQSLCREIYRKLKKNRINNTTSVPTQLPTDELMIIFMHFGAKMMRLSLFRSTNIGLRERKKITRKSGAPARWEQGALCPPPWKKSGWAWPTWKF